MGIATPEKRSAIRHWWHISFSSLAPQPKDTSRKGGIVTSGKYLNDNSKMKQLVQPWLFLLTHVSSCYAKAQRKCGDEACCHHWSDNLKLIHPFKAMTGEALRVSNCIEVIKRVKCIEVSLSGAPSYEFSDTLLSIGSPHTLRLLVRAKMAKTFTVQPTAHSMGHNSPIHPIPTSSRH